MMLTSFNCRCVLLPAICSRSTLAKRSVMSEQQRFNSRYGSKSGSLLPQRSKSYERPFKQFGTESSSKCFKDRAHNFHHDQRRASTHSHVNLSVSPEEEDCTKLKEEKQRYRMCSKRNWEFTNLGRGLHRGEIKQPSKSMKFTVLSYNVLAQHLLEEHTYLYRGVDPEVLCWESRGPRILREVRDSKADVLCLQEVQSNHFDTFYVPKLEELGFQGIFKKRTGDKPDGCAIFWRKTKFELRNNISVEYCKPNVQLLDRDNIGLIALLTPKSSLKKIQKSDATALEEPFICVATTHLLYNPKRHDIKLAQLQLLFAELDHIAYKSGGSQQSHSYHPVILTGDFNLSPKTLVYQFITRGSLQYKGLGRELTPILRGQVLANELIPPHLNITDHCQHVHATRKRISISITTSSISSNDGAKKREEVNTVESSLFSSGKLSHQLRLHSVYPHKLNRLKGADEVTTHQNDWVTVDYIFHNGTNQNDSPLRLLNRLGLLAGKELDSLGGLPSLASPSDHLPLVASFLWNTGSEIKQ